MQTHVSQVQEMMSKNIMNKKWEIIAYARLFSSYELKELINAGWHTDPIIATNLAMTL